MSSHNTSRVQSMTDTGGPNERESLVSDLSSSVKLSAKLEKKSVRFPDAGCLSQVQIIEEDEPHTDSDSGHDAARVNERESDGDVAEDALADAEPEAEQEKRKNSYRATLMRLTSRRNVLSFFQRKPAPSSSSSSANTARAGPQSESSQASPKSVSLGSPSPSASSAQPFSLYSFAGKTTTEKQGEREKDTPPRKPLRKKIESVAGERESDMNNSKQRVLVPVRLSHNDGRAVPPLNFVSQGETRAAPVPVAASAVPYTLANTVSHTMPYFAQSEDPLDAVPALSLSVPQTHSQAFCASSSSLLSQSQSQSQGWTSTESPPSTFTPREGERECEAWSAASPTPIRTLRPPPLSLPNYSPRVLSSHSESPNAQRAAQWPSERERELERERERERLAALSREEVFAARDESDDAQLALCLSEQEARFGVNMMDVLSAEELDKIKAVSAREGANCIAVANRVFEIKLGVSQAPPQPPQTQVQSFLMPSLSRSFSFSRPPSPLPSPRLESSYTSSESMDDAQQSRHQQYWHQYLQSQGDGAGGATHNAIPPPPVDVNSPYGLRMSPRRTLALMMPANTMSNTHHPMVSSWMSNTNAALAPQVMSNINIMPGPQHMVSNTQMMSNPNTMSGNNMAVPNNNMVYAQPHVMSNINMVSNTQQMMSNTTAVPGSQPVMSNISVAPGQHVMPNISMMSNINSMPNTNMVLNPNTTQVMSNMHSMSDQNSVQTMFPNNQAVSQVYPQNAFDMHVEPRRQVIHHVYPQQMMHSVSSPLPQQMALQQHALPRAQSLPAQQFYTQAAPVPVQTVLINGVPTPIYSQHALHRVRSADSGAMFAAPQQTHYVHHKMW